jgi:hypothetical protein
MDQNEFRQLKESGGTVTDAALRDAETTIIDDREEVITESEDVENEEEHEEQEDQQEQEEDEEDDLPPLNEKEKTAFEKRRERDEKKLREQLEAEYEQKYGRHKQVIEMLGGDPDAIEKRIRDNQLAQEAQRLAEANDWSDEDTQWYINQQKQERELKELRVQSSINKLSANPDYAGISTMEKEILAKIDQTKGQLSVEEAYWALGGHKKAEQIRLEAQMRESVKRQKTPRTVITDTQVSTTTEKPLPSDVVRDAERMGISATEARKLMTKEPVNNIDEWRARNKASK